MSEGNVTTVQHDEYGTPDEYVEIPHGPRMRQEPVIKGKGTPVWVLYMYHTKLGLTPEQISERWLGQITPEEVRAAIQYGQAHPDEVPDKTLG